MFMRVLKTPTISFVALLVLAIAPLAAEAQSVANALAMCKASKIALDKIKYCSIALEHTSDRISLERLYLRRGNSFMELSRFSEAVKDFSCLIRINPRVAGYFDNRLVALRGLGLNQEALADANAEVSLAPDKAFVYRSRGLLLETLQKYDVALRDFDQGLSINPADNGLVIDRARIKSKMGRTREAINELTQVITAEPSNLAAYRERGMAYVAAGDLDGALSDLSFVARTAPNDQEVTSTLEIIRARNQQTSPSAAPSQN